MFPKFRHSVIEMVLLSHLHNGQVSVPELLSHHLEDLSIVTKNGVFTSSKLVFLSIFPQISEYLPDYFICYDVIQILLPDFTVEDVRQAFETLANTGETLFLENVFGFNETDKIDTDKLDIIHGRHDNPEATVDENIVSSEVFYAYNEKNIITLEEVIIKEEETYHKEKTVANGDSISEINLSNDKIQKVATGGNGKKPNYKCDECERVFRDRGNTKRHKRLFHKTILKCDRCDEDFLGYDNLRDHRKKCLYYCDKCDWKTDRLDKMEAHKRGHARREMKTIPLVEKVVVVYR